MIFFSFVTNLFIGWLTKLIGLYLTTKSETKLFFLDSRTNGSLVPDGFLLI